MTIRLRALTSEDLGALTVLDRQLFADPWPPAQFFAAIEGPRYALGAFEGERLVGYLIGAAVAGEGELLQIGVATVWQRRGVAARLFDRFTTWLRQQGAGALYLEVRESAHPAIGFYRCHGFEPCGRRRGYYPGPAGREDALLFRLDLSRGEVPGEA